MVSSMMDGRVSALSLQQYCTKSMELILVQDEIRSSDCKSWAVATKWCLLSVLDLSPYRALFNFCFGA